MVMTYDAADPFLLRLNRSKWEEQVLVENVRGLADRQSGPSFAEVALALVMSVALAAFALTMLGAARTQGPIVAANVSVRYNDLDFSHTDDAQVLLDRIQDAAVQACGGTPDLRDVGRIAPFDQCRRTAIRRAVRRVAQPIVTALADTESMPMRLAVR